ncbi:hypothetical protein MTO96_041783 [Rhipicephalus appendiculatus]
MSATQEKVTSLILACRARRCEEMVFGEDISTQEDQASGWITTGSGARAVAGRKILTLLLPRVGNNPSGGSILLCGDAFAGDHLLVASRSEGQDERQRIARGEKPQ